MVSTWRWRQQPQPIFHIFFTMDGRGRPVKRHLGSRDTHGTRTGHTGAVHTGTRITQTGRLNTQVPGAERSPRPTQKRPPPANPTLPASTCSQTVRLPAPARTGGRRNEGARGRCVTMAGTRTVPVLYRDRETMFGGTRFFRHRGKRVCGVRTVKDHSCWCVRRARLHKMAGSASLFQTRTQ